MFSKLFPSDEQLWNRKETFESRIIAYTPEVMMMEWTFPNAGHVIPLHDHYHVQMSYILKGSAKITLADGTEKNRIPLSWMSSHRSDWIIWQITSRR